ncbi:MAG: exodeoxyribonuclease VII small subunit [Lachnospiraceae bacterium]|nr:exodeoxyribonuclease VII small subunit [Lachnospiraceae bacterium]MBD5497309.1 exodeoxyribonuclease VII small subunit [Lachnospiraceae bacterium]MBD5512135.1 exodeoxyribonuclease VII small subunit [Lachnospiraceae bacterium]MDE5802683.1 exodeoxyribonuclease VII small subunit [Lachnospiraceae bacterium]
MTIEEKFAKLEETVTRLESEDISLEESFRIYKEGMELLKKCNADIDKVEKQVMQLNGEGALEEFA